MNHFYPVRFVLLVCCLILNMGVGSAIAASLPAFPGAQGFGVLATGGRGGTVYHVTNLNDSGTGSFRDAVSAGNRIIVFDVCGYITLSSEVAMKSNITLAGQTAPGGGIGIRGAEVSFGSQSNIIVRNIRFRPGSGAASTDNGLNFYQAHNVILDHVSIEFASWNNIDATTGDWQTHPINGITVQNSIDADPIGQQFGAHTEAPNGQWSWFNNLFANSHNRNPLAKVNTVFINNALYNCDAGYTTHTSSNFSHDIVNNYFVAGPASGGNFPWFQIDNNQSIYSPGNRHDSSLDGALNGGTTQPLPGYQGGGTVLNSPWSTITASYPTVDAASAYRRAISWTGAVPWDEVDTLVVSQAKTLGSGSTGTGAGTRGPDGGLYTSETQTGLGNAGFGVIACGSKPSDSDNDGVPDYWETAVGWNPNSADSLTLGPDGYDHLENYVNWLADPHAVGISGGNIDLDLSQFSTGFTNNPVFSVSGAVNGSVSVLADGHTARFVSNGGFSGLANYHFTVTDSVGSTMTLTVGVLVQPGSLTVTPTRTSTAPPTRTATATATRTDTPVATFTFTVTRTNTSTFTFSPTSTATFTLTRTNTATNTATRTNTPTFSFTPTPTVTFTLTRTNTATNTPTKTKTLTFTFTSTATPTSTATRTNTPIPPTSTPTATRTPTSAAPTATFTDTNTPGAPTSTSTPTPTPTLTAVSAQVVIQPENNCGFSGTIDNNHLGFTGTGFANLTNNNTAGITFALNSTIAQNLSITFRYSDGTTTARPMLLNRISPTASTPVTVNFGVTTNWDTWGTITVTVPLVAGNNLISLVPTEANTNGGPNLDELTFTSSTVTAGNCGGSASAKILSGAPSVSQAATTRVMAAPNVSRNGSPIQFRVTLGQPGEIQLTLFTVAGEKVYEAEFQGQAAVNHLTWDLANQSGSQVASGCFIYKVHTNEGAFTGKVAVLR